MAHVADCHRPPVDDADDTLTGDGLKVADGISGKARSCAPATIALASGCSLTLSRLAASRSSVVSSTFGAPHHHELRPAFGQRARLVHDDDVHLFQNLERRGVSNSTPASAPRPVPTMIDIGVASPSAHGQAMIKTATALTSA